MPSLSQSRASAGHWRAPPVFRRPRARQFDPRAARARRSGSLFAAGPKAFSMAAAAQAASRSLWQPVHAFGEPSWRAQVRPRDPEGMVVPGIDAHVVPGRHVAGRALRASRTGRVQGMRRCVVFRRQVALRADRIAGRARLARMRIVAVAAGNAGCMHLALQERADVVHLIELLAIGEIQAIAQQRNVMRLEQPAVVIHALGERRTARMALRADAEFPAGSQLHAARRVAGRRHGAPN